MSLEPTLRQKYYPPAYTHSIINFLFYLQYDRLPMVVYEIPWHDLTPSDQKMLLVFLQHSQKPKKLSIIGESTLNVETGVAVRT